MVLVGGGSRPLAELDLVHACCWQGSLPCGVAWRPSTSVHRRSSGLVVQMEADKLLAV